MRWIGVVAVGLFLQGALPLASGVVDLDGPGPDAECTRGTVVVRSEVDTDEVVEFEGWNFSMRFIVQGHRRVVLRGVTVRGSFAVCEDRDGDGVPTYAGKVEASRRMEWVVR